MHQDSDSHAAGGLLDRIDRFFFFLLSSLLVVFIFQFSLSRLSSGFFWWDEAGQFWMSQGQAHVYPFGEPQGAVWNGVENGRNGSNLDPIGFTVLLRVWIDSVGSSPSILRIFPLAFFLLTLALSVFVGRRIFNVPWTLSLAIPAYLLFFNLPIRYALELRAFSLELLAVLSLASLVVAYTVSGRRALLILIYITAYAGIVLTRYSFIIAVGAASVTLVITMLMKDRTLFRKASLLSAGLAIPPLIFIAWNTGVFGGANQRAPRYYTGSMDLSESVTPAFLVEVFLQNFVRNGQIIVLAFLAAVLAALFVFRSQRQIRITHSVPNEIGQRNPRAWVMAAVYVIAYEFVAACVSVLGLSPWWSSGRWSIGLYSAAIIAGYGLVQVLTEMLRASPFLSSYSTAVIISGALLISIPTALLLVQKGERISNAITSMMSVEQSTHPFVELVDVTSSSIPDRSIAFWQVHPWVWPSFRMLWETDNLDAMEFEPPVDAEWIDTGLSVTDAELSASVAKDLRCGQDLIGVVLVLPIDGKEPVLTRMSLESEAERLGCRVTKIYENDAGFSYLVENGKPADAQ